MSLENDLKNIVGTNTLPEGKDIINENFDRLIESLSQRFTAENVENLLVDGELNPEYLTSVQTEINQIISDIENGNFPLNNENLDASTFKEAFVELYDLIQERLKAPSTPGQVNNVLKFGQNNAVLDSGVNANQIVKNEGISIENSVAVFSDSSGKNLTYSGVPGEPNGFALLDNEGKLAREYFVEESETRIFVDNALGNDSYDGRDITRPFKTIKAAVASATPGTTIFVAAGDYEEDNPIYLPPRVSIVGDELRNTRVYAKNPKLDYFHVNSLDYIYGLRFINLQRPAFTVAFPSSLADSVLTNDTVSNINVLYSYSGYDETPDVFIDPPELPTQTITRIDVTDGGSGYIEAPEVIISGGNPIKPAFAQAVVEEGSVTEIVLTNPGFGFEEPPVVTIEEPDSGVTAQANVVIGVSAEAEAVLVDGTITEINVTNPGLGYTERPRVSIAAPKEYQPIIIGSPYIQNCSSITGPFDEQEKLISPLAPLPYDFENGFTYTHPFTQEVITHSPVDQEGAGGGMRIDGRVCYGYNNLTEGLNVKSPLRSMVADSFTQVNQGGPGHLITNVGYAQFVSCFTTFCTYAYKARNGGFANISNSVTDFGNYGLIAEGYEQDFYTFGFSKNQQASSVQGINITNAGSNYSSPPNVTITSSDGNGLNAQAISELNEDGSVSSIIVTDAGSGYTSPPIVTIEESVSGETAQAEAVLSGVSTIRLNNIYEENNEVRRPDVGSVARINEQWVTVRNVEEIEDGYEISIFPAAPSVNQGEQIYLYALSNLSTGSHVFEYPGTGVTYNALPQYGGVPNPEREITSVAPGIVYFSSTDNIGNFKVGPFFNVEQATGAVTINADSFNLSGVNAIGPFKTDGVPYGVQLREVTNNVTLESNSGLDENTVPTVFAVREYISTLELNNLANVTIDEVALQNKDFIRWDSLSGQWEISKVSLDDLTDVNLNVVTPQTGLALVYGTNDWQPGYPSAALSLDTGTNNISASDVYQHVNNLSGTNPHNLIASDVGAIPTSEKGSANGVAPLNSSGEVPFSNLPGFVLNGNVYAVNDDAERNALSASEGDVVRVSNSAEAGGTAFTYVYDEDTQSWLPFNLPESVISVNGQVGAVSLTTTDIPEGSNEYYQESKVDARINSVVNEGFVNEFNLSAQELRDSSDPTVVVDAVGVYDHLNNVFVPGETTVGKNPHNITPELIDAVRESTVSTDVIPEGNNNLYFDINLVTKDYIDSLGINAATLNEIGSPQFIRSDENDVFTGEITGNKLVLGNQKISVLNDDTLEVNGSLRTGNIYLHQDGEIENIPSNTSEILQHKNNDLFWGENKVWHEGNQGAGSTLNADLLDGLEASYFAPDGHTHSANEIVSGQFANSRISSSSVVQHQSDLTIFENQISDLQDYLLRSELSSPNGVAGLDSNGIILNQHLPPDVFSKVDFVQLDVSKDSLDVQEGDFVKVEETQKVFVYSDENDWVEINKPDDVNSVNGYQGIITLVTDDVGEGENPSNKYYTESRFDTSFSGKTTDDLTEGPNSLYFTNARADSRVQSAIDDESVATNVLWSSEKILNNIQNIDSDVTITGNLTIDGTVDNVDISDFKSSFDNHVHDASDITTGTFNDNRISESNVTQHQAALEIDGSQIVNFSGSENSTITINSGAALTGSGSFTLNQSSDATITIAHADTSSVASSTNSTSGEALLDLSFDDYGHVTSFTKLNLDNIYLKKSADGFLNMNNNIIYNVEDIALNDRIYHRGDTNTYIRFASDTIRFYTGNSQRLFINNSEIRAYRIFRSSNDIVAYYSDERLKNKIGYLENSLEKIHSLNAFYYKENDLAKSFGYTDEETKIGLSAQEVENVLPEIVKPAPFDIEIDDEGNEYSKSGENYKTIQYEKLVPLLVEAIKELSHKVEVLENGITN